MLPRGQAATPGGIFGCCRSGRRVLLDLVGKRPGTMLEFCGVQDSLQQQSIIQPKMSLVLGLRNSAFNFFMLKLTFKLTVDTVTQKA